MWLSQKNHSVFSFWTYVISDGKDVPNMVIPATWLWQEPHPKFLFVRGGQSEES